MTSSPRRVEPPSGGTPPPTQAAFDGRDVLLLPLAEAICRRYRDEFRDEEERYGDAGLAWCVHDLQWILWWAGEDDLGPNVAWLARVLAAREFPVARLARALDLAADAVDDELGSTGEAAAELRRQAEALRAA